jgi:hypothetical protein
MFAGIGTADGPRAKPRLAAGDRIQRQAHDPMARRRLPSDGTILERSLRLPRPGAGYRANIQGKLAPQRAAAEDYDWGRSIGSLHNLPHT